MITPDFTVLATIDFGSRQITGTWGGIYHNEKPHIYLGKMETTKSHVLIPLKEEEIREGVGGLKETRGVFNFSDDSIDVDEVI